MATRSLRMLPLIPALILLLLQGPSNVEKLAHEGRLPAALDAVHQSLINSERHSPERDALAQIIAASGDVSLSRALAHLLTLVADSPNSSGQSRAVVETWPPFLQVARATPSPTDGILRSQRTRDGPKAIGAMA